jgi:hypothetical protein
MEISVFSRACERRLVADEDVRDRLGRVDDDGMLESAQRDKTGTQICRRKKAARLQGLD